MQRQQTNDGITNGGEDAESISKKFLTHRLTPHSLTHSLTPHLVCLVQYDVELVLDPD